MAGSAQFLPVEGFLQKKGGGTSLLGSKSWAQRYIRIENGELSWWKKKEDASSGAAPQKDARVPLNKYSIEASPVSADGKYFVFKIVLDTSAVDSGSKLRASYEFRVHEKADMESWIMQFKAHGCRDATESRSIEDIHREALSAAAPPELINQLRGIQGTEDAAAAAGVGAAAAALGTSASPASAASQRRAPAAPARSPSPKAPATPPEPEPEPEPEEEEEVEEEAEEEAEEEVEEEEAGEIDENDPNSLWDAYQDDEGDWYYVNKLTEDSVWEEPEGFTNYQVDE